MSQSTLNPKAGEFVPPSMPCSAASTSKSLPECYTLTERQENAISSVQSNFAYRGNSNHENYDFRSRQRGVVEGSNRPRSSSQNMNLQNLQQLANPQTSFSKPPHCCRCCCTERRTNLATRERILTSRKKKLSLCSMHMAISNKGQVSATGSPHLLTPFQNLPRDLQTYQNRSTLGPSGELSANQGNSATESTIRPPSTSTTEQLKQLKLPFEKVTESEEEEFNLKDGTPLNLRQFGQPVDTDEAVDLTLIKTPQYMERPYTTVNYSVQMPSRTPLPLVEVGKSRRPRRNNPNCRIPLPATVGCVVCGPPPKCAENLNTHAIPEALCKPYLGSYMPNTEMTISDSNTAADAVKRDEAIKEAERKHECEEAYEVLRVGWTMPTEENMSGLQFDGATFDSEGNVLLDRDRAQQLVAWLPKGKGLPASVSLKEVASRMFGPSGRQF